jgi:hypothetical protein
MIDIQNFIFDKKNRAHFNFGDVLTTTHSKAQQAVLFSTLRSVCVVGRAGTGRAGKPSLYIYIYINLKKDANNTTHRRTPHTHTTHRQTPHTPHTHTPHTHTHTSSKFLDNRHTQTKTHHIEHHLQIYQNFIK